MFYFVQYNMNYKAYLLLFVLFIILQSRQFTDNILSRFNGAMDPPGVPTQYGQVIQGTILVIAYMCVVALIDQQVHLLDYNSLHRTFPLRDFQDPFQVEVLVLDLVGAEV